LESNRTSRLGHKGHVKLEEVGCWDIFDLGLMELYNVKWWVIFSILDGRSSGTLTRRRGVLVRLDGILVLWLLAWDGCVEGFDAH
jgi:hypothetical protein